MSNVDVYGKLRTEILTLLRPLAWFRVPIVAAMIPIAITTNAIQNLFQLFDIGRLADMTMNRSTVAICFPVPFPLLVPGGTRK